MDTLSNKSDNGVILNNCRKELKNDRICMILRKFLAKRIQKSMTKKHDFYSNHKTNSV